MIYFLEKLIYFLANKLDLCIEKGIEFKGMCYKFLLNRF
jgi:hypothetical protein